MKAGRIFIAVMFVVGLIGILVNGAVIFSRFFYSALLLTIAAWIWTHWVARGFVFERSAREFRANVGDVFEENYKLMSRGRLPAPWVEITNRSPIPFAAGSRLFTLVGGRQARSYTARTWLTSRGRFSLGPTKITTGDPFGLFTSGKEFPAKDNLIVFPMIHPIQSFPTPDGLLTGGQVIRKKSLDITPHASGVREYVHGDAMKRIHWPTSARRGHLMVKEFEQDPQAEIWIFLDAQKVIHYQKRNEEGIAHPQNLLLVRRPKITLPPSTFEYSVSIAASLAHYFIGQRRAVGLASTGQTLTVLPADRSERQEAKILETLAFLEADAYLSLAGLVATQAALLPQGSTAILITPTTRPDLLQAVDDLLLRYLAPVVVLLDSKSFGGPSGTQKLIDSLHERRVPVIPVSCDDNLSQSLSVLSADIRLQEMNLWQTPAYVQST